MIVVNVIQFVNEKIWKPQLSYQFWAQSCHLGNVGQISNEFQSGLFPRCSQFQLESHPKLFVFNLHHFRYQEFHLYVQETVFFFSTSLFFSLVKC